MLENFLIDCCAPTLASLKSGSLFNCRHDNDCPALEKCVQEWNSEFAALGIRMQILRMTDHSALIYVYRETSLAKSLSDPEIQSFLEGYGYSACCFCDGCSLNERMQCGIEGCLEHLRDRISECGGDFPHEIGVFLDYPLDDVRGFIENSGRNCKMVGAWKVYGDEDQARKRFARFTKCTSVYSDLWRSGRRSVLQLTVAG